MATDQSQPKTESPTTKRREDSRKQGQVPLSQELTTAIMLIASLGALYGWGANMGDRAIRLVFGEMSRLADHPEINSEYMVRIVTRLVITMLEMVGWVSITVSIVVIAGTVAQ